MSVSSSRRYSLSASSTPARKAPSAIDRPTELHQRGDRHHQQQRGGGEDLRRVAARDPAQQRAAAAAGRPARCRRSRRRSSAASQPAGCRRPCVGRGRASSGSSARIGIAATSWNSRIEKPACPLVVGSRLRSPITCSAMAVEDSARPSAATRRDAPVDAGRPCRAANSSGGAAQHLRAAPAEDRPAQAPQAARLQLQADQEQHQHHAELGEMQDVLARCSPGPGPRGRWRCRRPGSRGWSPGRARATAAPRSPRRPGRSRLLVSQAGACSISGLLRRRRGPVGGGHVAASGRAAGPSSSGQSG